MSLNTLTNQTIALAGIAQTTALVQELATTGTSNQLALNASIGSILKLDSENVIEIFGDLAGLKAGLTQFQQQITGYQINHPEQARYAAALVYLERKLNTNAKMLEQIQTGIQQAQTQVTQFGILHENVLANLGDLYHATISTLEPRIMINGDQQFLSRPDVVNKIRALLLAGIRAALLWRQCGGSRWKFLFYRNKLQTEVNFLLTQI